MKIKHKLLSWLLFLTTITIGLWAFSQGQKQSIDVLTTIKQHNKINWGVKNDTNLFALYNIDSRSLEGFDIDIAKELTRRITGDADNAIFTEVTSKTRIPLLKNGNINAIIATMTITAEREKVVDFSDVYFAAGQSLLVPEASTLTGVHDLTNSHTVIAVKGSSSATNIRAAAPQANILELENYAEAFTALQAGQGDAVTTDNAILLGMQSEVPGYKLVGGTFTDEPYGIAVDDGQNDLRETINQALADMRADGTYDAIYKKWFNEAPTEEAT